MSEKREAWHYDATEGRPLWSKSFSTWKFAVIDAMMTDKHLLASDFRVGVALLRHLSRETWSIFPSQGRLADLTDMSPRNVIKCLERLRLAGWIRWARGNRQKANEYAFDLDAIDAQIERVRVEDLARRAHRNRRSDVNPSSPQKRVSTRTAVHIATRTAVHTNTSMEGSTTSTSVRKGAA